MNAKEIAEFLSNYWYRKEGLIVALITTFAFTATLLATSSAHLLIWIITFNLTWAIIVFAWFLGQRLPRVKKNKIGFVVSINCSNPTEIIRLQEDFIDPLKRLILSGESGKSFDFISLPQHLARKIITSEDAVRVRVKMRAHFMIFGGKKLRSLNGVEHHMIDLHGTVGHLPVTDELSRTFTNEFSEFLPRKVRIPTDNDAVAFEFTSEWADIVARYVIANAAMFSGDLIYAEQLLIEASQKLPGMDSRFPIYGKLKERIPLRLADLYETLAMLHHRAWVEEFDRTNIEKISVYLGKVPLDHTNRRTIIVLNAICEFWLHRNCKKSIELISLLLKKYKNDPILHYNLGFLNAYVGNMKLAIRYYRKACAMGVDSDELYQIEEFINKILEIEPDKVQLYYCLGFFNKEAKGDYLMAEHNLMKFIQHCPPNVFQTEVGLATQWLLELPQPA